MREGVKLPKLRTRPITFRELAVVTLAYSKVNKRSHADDVCRMKTLVREFGNRAAEDITPEEIETALDSCGKWSLGTRNRHIALLKLTYRLAERAKRIKSNPARLLQQRKENNGRVRFLSAKEEVALRTIIEQRYPEHMAEFEIGLHTGMRRGEQYGMTWDGVDLDTAIVTVPRAKHGELRYVKLNSRVLAILKALHARSIGTGPVFLTKSPRHWFEPAVRAAGLAAFTWHDLRHTFASPRDGRC